MTKIMDSMGFGDIGRIRKAPPLTENDVVDGVSILTEGDGIFDEEARKTSKSSKNLFAFSSNV